MRQSKARRCGTINSIPGGQIGSTSSSSNRSKQTRDLAINAMRYWNRYWRISIAIGIEQRQLSPWRRRRRRLFALDYLFVWPQMICFSHYWWDPKRVRLPFQPFPLFAELKVCPLSSFIV